MQTPVEEKPAGPELDRRHVAVAAALLLAAVVAVVVLSSTGGPNPAPIPRGCLELWRGDSRALVYGRHDYLEHEYEIAQVQLLDLRGEPAGTKHGGRCAVVFAASQLDPESRFAGQRYTGTRWIPLSRISQITDLRLAELQAQAQSAANVILRPDGTLHPRRL